MQTYPWITKKAYLNNQLNNQFTPNRPSFRGTPNKSQNVEGGGTNSVELMPYNTFSLKILNNKKQNQYDYSILLETQI